MSYELICLTSYLRDYRSPAIFNGVYAADMLTPSSRNLHMDCGPMFEGDIFHLFSLITRFYISPKRLRRKRTQRAHRVRNHARICIAWGWM